jgi:hypothetical protein
LECNIFGITEKCMKDVLNLDILLKGSPILGKGGGGRET